MSLHASVRTAAFAAAVSILTASGASAQSTYSNTTADGLWNTAGNWSNGVPTTAVAATLSLAGAGSVDLGGAGSALSLAVNGNYSISNGVLTVQGGTTSNSINVADTYSLTLADNTLQIGSALLRLTTNGTAPTAAQNGTINLGASQSGLAGTLDIANVNLVFSSGSAFGSALIDLNGGDREGESTNIARFTATASTTISNNIEMFSSPFSYLQVSGGNTVTFSGDMLRQGGNQRLGSIGSQGGTTVNIGQATVGGTTPYSGGTGINAVNGTINVYRSNAATPEVFVNANHRGLLTGSRAQPDAVPSVINFINQTNGGTNQYLFSAFVNESANDIGTVYSGVNKDVTLNVQANADVDFSGLGSGVVLDLRGTMTKTGEGSLTFRYFGGSSGTGTRGGIATGSSAGFEGRMSVMGGRVNFVATGLGRSTDDIFDGSASDNANGIVNYVFGTGTTLGVNFTDTSLTTTYNMKSDVTIGAASGDVVTFDILTGGGVAGKPMGMAAGIAAKANPTTTFNGTLVKTGAGQLTLGGGAARNYVANAGSGMTVSAGRVVVSSPNFNTPNLAVTNNALVQVTGTGNASVGSLVGTGTTEIAAGGKLRVGGGSNSQANLNNAGEFRGGGVMTLSGAYSSGGGSLYGTGIASASSFDRLVVTGAAGINGTLEIDMLGGYNPLPSDLFPIVTSSAVSGTFTNVNSWGLITVLGGGRAFVPQYGATDVVLTDYARIGDVNRDGAVNNLDIASFVGLLTGNPAAGSVGFAGDVNGDGVVNNLDIAPFVALLTGGRPVGDDPEFAPLLSLVPEPTSLSLLALGGLMLGRRRRNV